MQSLLKISLLALIIAFSTSLFAQDSAGGGSTKDGGFLGLSTTGLVVAGIATVAIIAVVASDDGSDDIIVEPPPETPEPPIDTPTTTTTST